MPGVVFFFEYNDIDVYSGRTIDLDAWHLASLIPGDIDEMIVVNKTNETINRPNWDIDFTVVKELPELNNAVYLDPVRGGSLWDFNHKVDWYVFGPANGWSKKVDRNYINIPSNDIHCHSQHVMTTVMFHRHWIVN